MSTEYSSKSSNRKDLWKFQGWSIPKIDCFLQKIQSQRAIKILSMCCESAKLCQINTAVIIDILNKIDFESLNSYMMNNDIITSLFYVEKDIALKVISKLDREKIKIILSFGFSSVSSYFMLCYHRDGKYKFLILNSFDQEVVDYLDTKIIVRILRSVGVNQASAFLIKRIKNPEKIASIIEKITQFRLYIVLKI